MATEWIAVAQDRVGKVEDIAICNSVELARMYADRFAKQYATHAVIRIFKAEPIEVQAGQQR
jgi:hypothetical protein